MQPKERSLQLDQTLSGFVYYLLNERLRKKTHSNFTQKSWFDDVNDDFLIDTNL